MLVMTSIVILTVVYATWVIASGWAFRKPERLLLCGLVVSGFATVAKYNPIVWKTAANSPWSAHELELASAIVDPTLVGLAGGLIAAAIMLRVQIMYATEIREAKATLTRSIEIMEDVERADEDLKLVARSLSNDEFRLRLRIIKVARLNALLENLDAERKLKKKKVPGLPGNDET
jgi:hypothetical protein